MRNPAIIIILCIVSGCKSIPAPIYADRPGGKTAILVEPLVWDVDQYTIKVPAGFYTDFASVPWPFSMLLPVHDSYSRAAIVHDYLYWTQLCTRKEADNILLIGMKMSGVDAVRRDAVYAGVRLGGWVAWKENRTTRARPLPRVIPASDIRKVADIVKIDEYRAGLTPLDEADIVGKYLRPAYCDMGRSTTAPKVIGEVTDYD